MVTAKRSMVSHYVRDSRPPRDESCDYLCAYRMRHDNVGSPRGERHRTPEVGDVEAVSHSHVPHVDPARPKHLGERPQRVKGYDERIVPALAETRGKDRPLALRTT
jgi:hypothetical protein